MFANRARRSHRVGVAGRRQRRESTPGSTPELLQEKRRVGLRCSLTAEQLKLVMEKLGQSGLTFPTLSRGPKA